MDPLKSRTLAWMLVLAAGVNSCAGNLLLKKARLAPQPGLSGMLLNPWFLGGLFFYGINVILFGKALDRLPVSTAYPALAGCGFALLSVFAALIFQERFTPIQALGLAAIFFGIILMARA
jgi:multidrug transporter EmrE-like cation transporter